MLLQHIIGPTCFNDLYIIGGYKYDTFKNACYSMGLIRKDKECEEAINEAFEWKIGLILEKMFVLILMHYEVINSVAL